MKALLLTFIWLLFIPQLSYGQYFLGSIEDLSDEQKIDYMVYQLHAYVDDNEATSFKSKFEELKLNGINQHLQESVLSKLSQSVSLQDSRWGIGSAIKFDPAARMNNLAQLLENSQIAKPGKFEQFKELAQSKLKAKTDPQSFINKLKETVAPEDFKNVLSAELTGLLFEGNSAQAIGPYFDELTKGEIDQNQIGQLLRFTLWQTTQSSELEAWQKKLAQLYDFNHTFAMFGMGEENILCSQLPANLSIGMNQVNEANVEPQPIPKEIQVASEKVIKRLIELGADVNVTCNDGVNFLSKMYELKRIGLLDENFYQESKANVAPAPCLANGPDLMELGDLCNVAEIVGQLGNLLNRNERQLPSQFKNLQFQNGIESNSCDVVLLDRHMKDLSGNVNRSLEVRVISSAQTGKKEFVLTGKNRAEFVDALQRLIKSK